MDNAIKAGHEMVKALLTDLSRNIGQDLTNFETATGFEIKKIKLEREDGKIVPELILKYVYGAKPDVPKDVPKS